MAAETLPPCFDMLSLCGRLREKSAPSLKQKNAEQHSRKRIRMKFSPKKFYPRGGISRSAQTPRYRKKTSSPPSSKNLIFPPAVTEPIFEIANAAEARNLLYRGAVSAQKR